MGGESGVDYVRNLNKANLQSVLNTKNLNLITCLRDNYPNANVEEIVGAGKIVPEYLDGYPESMHFPSTPVYTWDEIPDEYVHKIWIQHGDINTELSIPEISGKRLSITYDDGYDFMTATDSQHTPSISESYFLSLEEFRENTLKVDSFSPLTQFVKPIETIVEPKLAAPISQTLVEPENGLSRLVEPDNLEYPEYTATLGTSTWDFGKIYPEGWSTITSGSIQNTNTVTIQVIVTLNSNPSGAYSITSGGGTHTLAPGASFTFSLRFSGSGQSPGTKTGQVKLEYKHDGTTFAEDYI